MKFPALATTFLFVCCASFQQHASAFPTGAGACPGDQPAVGGSHLREDALVGSLAEGTVSVTIGDTLLSTGDMFNATLMEEYPLLIEAAAIPMKGLLVRLECRTDLTGAITTEDPLLQEAGVCAQDDNFVVGLTHNSNVEKDSVATTIVLDTLTTVSIDVTVVQYNNDTAGSAYFYDRFFFRAAHPPCDICGDLGAIGDPEAVIQIPPGVFPDFDQSEITCADANQLGMGGQIPAELCPLTPALAGPVCLCGGGVAVDGTNAPTTADAPTEADGPTEAPVEEGGGDEGDDAPTDAPVSNGGSGAVDIMKCSFTMVLLAMTTLATAAAFLWM